MLPRCFSVIFFLFLYTSVLAQEKFTVVKDLRSEWMRFDGEAYESLGDSPFTGFNTIYFHLNAQANAGTLLRLNSSKPYFLFVNGKITGEFQGETVLRVDSLLARWGHGASGWIAVNQDRINLRDLRTQIVSRQRPMLQAKSDTAARPYSHFRDFVVIAGMIIIMLFLVALRLNPKLAADYFSIRSVFSSRESDDGQASVRLTSSSNVQFYVICSLLTGFYLIIVFYNLPAQYALPLHFQASGFWMMSLQWLKLSAIIFIILFLKIVIVFSLTRLFGMRGMARLHFFNWVRLLLVVFSASTTVLFIYFITRGSSPAVFVLFLSLVVVALITWIAVAFFKLSGRSGHSMFHLFSYLCATEIIPLLITVKVLFQ